MKKKVIALMEKREVKMGDIAEIVLEIQKPFNKSLTFDECLYSVEKVIEKREVQHVILTGLALDKLAEEERLDNPLQEIIARDEPLYGVDETLAMGIATIYGTIGSTSFGYLDKVKLGIISRLNEKDRGINTFLDDIVAGIASAAAARIAHAQEAGDPEEDIS